MRQIVTFKSLIDVKKGDYITKKQAKEGPYPVILGGREPAYYIDKYNHTGRAIVISRSGASAGFVSAWNEPIFITDGFLIEPKEHVDYDFIYYALKNSEGILQGRQSGAAIPHITPRLIQNIEIELPSLSEQRKIAETLSKYDKLIENNQKQIKLLEEAAQRLYKEWFVDLRFPGYEDVQIVDGVPEGWSKKTVGELLGKVDRTTQIMTKDYKKQGSTPVIDQSRDFIAGYTDDKTSVVDLGRPVIVFGDHTRVLKYIQFPFAKGADGTQLLVSNSERMPQALLYCSLVEVDLSNYHYARHFKYLKAEEIIVPSLSVAERFDQIATLMFVKTQKIRDIIIQLTEARDRLLPKLMSGEIEL